MARTAAAIAGVDRRVQARVEVGRVLRPDHHVRRGPRSRRRPAGASCSVAAAWFCGHRGGPQQVRQVPACGTSPWMAATVAVGVPAAAVDREHRAAASRRPPSESPPARSRPGRQPVSRPAATVAPRHARRPGRRLAARRRQHQPGQRHAPASATRKVSSGAPPIATQRPRSARWPGSWPAGPTGSRRTATRSRTASAATHQPATASGQARSRSSSRWPTASTAKITASATGERSPRVPGDVDQPGQQRKEERRSRTRGRQQRSAQAPPPERDDEQRGPHGRERPDAHRRERRGQG